MVIWLIGLSGAGKTTIGTRLAQRLRESSRGVVYLDGDLLRDVWGPGLGHDLAARAVNAERVSKLCAMLDAQQLDVVAAVLSVFPEWRSWNRATFSSYFEVFLDVPMEVLAARDPKGIYGAARAGRLSDVVGVDIPFPRPERPDLVLDNSGAGADPDAMATRILQRLPERLR